VRSGFAGFAFLADERDGLLFFKKKQKTFAKLASAFAQRLT
jgi:hypothetical protein